MEALQENLRHVIRCPICYETYDEHRHQPKLLRCQHTYCNVCVKSCSRRGKVNCGMCRDETPIADVKTSLVHQQLLTAMPPPPPSSTTASTLPTTAAAGATSSNSDATSSSSGEVTRAGSSAATSSQSDMRSVSRRTMARLHSIRRANPPRQSVTDDFDGAISSITPGDDSASVSNNVAPSSSSSLAPSSDVNEQQPIVHANGRVTFHTIDYIRKVVRAGVATEPRRCPACSVQFCESCLRKASSDWIADHVMICSNRLTDDEADDDSFIQDVVSALGDVST